MTDWNTLYKRVRISHEMRRTDVVDCCRLGGMEISSSRADAWGRGETDTRRHIRMTAEEFDAFTSGLPAWAKQHYEQNQ